MKHFFTRLCFLIAVYAAAIKLRLRGRATAFNAVLTPMETSRGTQSMDADTGVVTTFRNAVVKAGSDDHHFALVASAADIPRGILLNDQVDAGEQGVIKKQVALFGRYPETLPGVASGAIAVDGYVVADPANPGQVMALPAAAGTYLVFGRSRFTVVNAGDPVSINHCLPFALTH